MHDAGDDAVDLTHLTDGDADLPEQPVDLAGDVVGGAGDCRHCRLDLSLMLLDVGASGVRQVKDALAVGLLADDQALVFEQLQGGIDRAWAWLPRTAAAGRDALDDFIAVEWLLGGLLAYMPLALGVVSPASETLVAAVAVAIAACLLGKRILNRTATQVWS